MKLFNRSSVEKDKKEGVHSRLKELKRQFDELIIPEHKRN